MERDNTHQWGPLLRVCGALFSFSPGSIDAHLLALSARDPFHLPLVAALWSSLWSSLWEVVFTGLRLRFGWSWLWPSQVALAVKNLSVNTGDIRNTRSIPVLERSPGGGPGKPLQYSCLGNPMDREAWWATVHRLTKNQIRLKRFSTHVQSWLHLWPQGWACDPDIKESSTLFQASRDGCTTRSVDIQLLYFGWVKNSAFYMWRTFLAASCKKLPNNNIYFIMLNTCFFLLLFSILENL